MKQSFERSEMSFSSQQEVVRIAEGFSTERRKSRKTFVTATLRKINSRIQYYRRVLNNPNTNIEQLERIRKKYEKDLRIRKLLNRAINNLYTL